MTPPPPYCKTPGTFRIVPGALCSPLSLAPLASSPRGGAFGRPVNFLLDA